MRRGLAGLLTAATLSLSSGLSACGNESPTKPIEPENPPVQVDNPPTESGFNVSPTSGFSPLDVSVKYSCNDDRGIAQYSFNAGNHTFSQASPIDTTLVFEEAGNFSGNVSCTDTGNQTINHGFQLDVQAQPVDSTPRISQSAKLVNFVDVVWSSLTENVSSAVRTIFSNGNFYSRKTIDTETYADSLTNLRKGDWAFIFEAEGVKPDTTTLEIPDYPLSADTAALESLERKVKSGSSIFLDLSEVFHEYNPEDGPAYVRQVRSLDGRTDVTIRENILEVKATAKDAGPYKIWVQYANQIDEVGEMTFSGEIEADGNNGSEGGPLLFWSDRDASEGELYSMQEDGSSVRRLTNNNKGEYDPSWSPDGTQIAFTSNREDVNNDGVGDIAVYLMGSDGSNPYRISPNLQFVRQPVFSPDGSRLAVVYYDSGKAGIGLMNPDGTGFAKLIEEDGSDTSFEYPSWSPDGNRITYQFNNKVYITDSSGGAPRLLTSNAVFPAWSPDGEWIAFASNRIGGSLDIYRLHPDGTGLERLTSAPGTEFDPRWTSDGRIVFSADYQISIMNGDGTNAVRLTSEGNNRYPFAR